MTVDAAQLRRELIAFGVIVPGDGSFIPTRLLGRVRVGLELDDAGHAMAARHIAAGDHGRREMQPPWTKGGQR